MNIRYFRVTILLPIIFFVAALSFVDAYVGLLRVNNPVAALPVYKDDPVSLAVKAEARILKGISASQLDEIGDWSKKSFLSFALNPRALGQIALSRDAQNTSTTTNTKTLMKIAQRMSRRDMIVQLWNIEQSASENKISEALRQYDIGMRVNATRRTYFFPALLTRINNEKFRAGLAKYISKNPPWLDEFMNYSIAQTDRPSLIAALISEGGGLPKEEKFRATEGALLAKLFITEGPSSARSFYTTFKYEATAKTLNSLNFDSISTNQNRNPISWITVKSPISESEFRASKGSQEFYLKGTVSPGQTDIIGRKLIYLPKGQYAPIIKFSKYAFGNGATALLKVSCVKLGSAILIWQDNIITSKTLSPLDVPSDCEAQYFDIVLYGGDNQEGAEIIVNSISLRKTA
jgi:hypothetical protein